MAWPVLGLRIGFCVMLMSDAVAPESLFEEMKRYVRFTDADADLLAELRRHAGSHFERIAQDFYERIREHERAHAVFTGEEQVRRLQKSLVRWMERVCSGPYDEAYFEQTAKIGRAHVRVGLPQHFVFTAMALIRVELERIADETLGARAAAARAAISRVLDLELAVMVESYRDDLVDRVERVNRIEQEASARTPAQSEHRYRSAVELARVMIVGLDGRGMIQLFNSEAERVTGFGREEVLGGPFPDLILADGAREEHGSLFRSAAAGLPVATEVLESAVRTRAGKVRDVRWQLAYSPTDADHEVVLFAIGQDTTDENALAARARQSERLASIGTLAAGLAHEIRNPLNGARLHLTFLERELKRLKQTDKKEMREAVRVVGDEIDRLSGLVTEFLDFARPQSLSKKRVSIRSLCERTTQVITPDAQAAHVEVRTELPNSDITLELDSAKMEQVLLNLLRNGIEAMAPAGGGKLVCRVLRQPRSAIIEIEDEGPGLPAPDAPIFDPFFSTKPKGTGLGLAIAHRIVTDHGGSIDASSLPGRTVFQVVLPIANVGHR